MSVREADRLEVIYNSLERGRDVIRTTTRHRDNSSDPVLPSKRSFIDVVSNNHGHITHE